MNNIWILAQAAGEQTPSSITAEPVTEQGKAMTAIPDSNAPAGGGKVNKGPAYSNLIFIVLMFVVMYLLLFRGPQKQKQQRKQLIKSLQKNDKVQTIGGIIGTIVDIKDDEITLKIDESNNTKIKIVSSAIGRNLSKDKD